MIAQQFVGAVAFGERGEAGLGAAVGGDLGAQIAPALVRRADIGEDDRLDIRVGLAVAIEPHRRQAQPLAVDLGHGAVAARRGAADIRPMRPHAAEPEQKLAEKARRDDIDVGQVRAAVIRVVVDEHVAGFDTRERRRSRARTASGIEPRWIGRSGPCATMLPRASKIPQE